MTAPPGQDESHWKNKYYDQLDKLEKKEKEWAGLESVLKRAVSRLTLAAEGQDEALDRHIRSIRTAIKNDIDRFRLESILDDLSKILAKAEQQPTADNKQIINALQTLLEPLELPAASEKARKKLLNRLSSATDEDKGECINDFLAILKQALLQPLKSENQKAGFFERFMRGSDGHDVDVSAMASIVAHVVRLMPWPDELKEPVRVLMDDTLKSETDKVLSGKISQLEKITDKWKSSHQVAEIDLAPVATQDADNGLETYRSFIMSFFDKFDNKFSPNGKISALRVMAKDAAVKADLDKLADDLAIILEQTGAVESDAIKNSVVSSDTDTHPNIQELLIRLLEQLIVPIEFHKDVDEMKARLEKHTISSEWKKLLKDVAELINSIRIRMQEEKHEFESFLQQVTSRLKEMDNFLQNEKVSVDKAEQQGKVFDVKVNDHVKEIRNDMSQAVDLDNLKNLVENRLENISKHIKEYRDTEEKRYINVKKDVLEMQNQMMSLEKESENLKTIIVEKNKQAMFDTLTEIPNRLAYEKKSAEEIARWKRFSNPLSLAVWDIDFFKKVNDTYGHKAGDKVLKTIAQLLNERIRETDFLARFGGEEFVMLLPGTKEEETLRLVNGLRKKVEACGFHYQGNAVSITVSCGISSFGEGDNLAKVFERADNALYKAKENGRNQCVVSSCRTI